MTPDDCIPDCHSTLAKFSGVRIAAIASQDLRWILGIGCNPLLRNAIMFELRRRRRLDQRPPRRRRLGFDLVGV